MLRQRRTTNNENKINERINIELTEINENIELTEINYFPDIHLDHLNCLKKQLLSDKLYHQEKWKENF